MLKQRKPMNPGKGFKPKVPDWYTRRLHAEADDVVDVEARQVTAKVVPMHRGTYAPVLDVVVAVPKDPHRVNKDLRQLAQRHGCQLRFAFGCLGSDTTTTVLCHENSLSACKGLGYKPHDDRAALGCAVCHSAIDYGKLPYTRKQAAMHAGIARTHELYARIAADRSQPPKDRLAAQWALDMAAAERARGKGLPAPTESPLETE